MNFGFHGKFLGARRLFWWLANDGFGRLYTSRNPAKQAIPGGWTGFAPKGLPGFATTTTPAYWEQSNAIGRIS
ncbi:protein of unknown function [Bradyrhizobium vignae]|uniref:Uncharacterized protein n=1 Tax=Bradyrhizobium vignae TaxID=1549949 RepID=A0A2U3QBA6_9BRAD|nr:protein of unknown function [Bradyrhizobium vignae]